jgi:hypothetical protein
MAQTMSDEDLVRRGLEIYEQRLKPLLEPHRNGAQIALHVEDGDYEVADSSVEADRVLRSRHPDAVFVYMEVGKPIMDWPWIRANATPGKP